MIYGDSGFIISVTALSFLIRIKTAPKTVQTLLRHSDVRLTLQSYTHAISDDRMSAAGAMLGAILNHAEDKSGLRADLEKTQPELSASLSRGTKKQPERVSPRRTESGPGTEEVIWLSSLESWWPGTELNRIGGLHEESNQDS